MQKGSTVKCSTFGAAITKKKKKDNNSSPYRTLFFSVLKSRYCALALRIMYIQYTVVLTFYFVSSYITTFYKGFKKYSVFGKDFLERLTAIFIIKNGNEHINE